MLEAMSGALLLVAGGWAWLLAFGKVKFSRDPERVLEFRRKYGVTLSILGILLMMFGFMRLLFFVLAGAEGP
ncbi:MAG: hypothetical protein LAT62_06140 [Natronospirillum sp.]|uniref:hypothetical protein n=1 Tax=Natronospirillum sp. TaxID=2812955 RepID=UPI00260029AD|nr:hypothetical protein [Natronospirillum sp.]MCH8551495.1 hypothetical protein [Natronospirillum sp.]